MIVHNHPSFPMVIQFWWACVWGHMLPSGWVLSPKGMWIVVYASSGYWYDLIVGQWIEWRSKWACLGQSVFPSHRFYQGNTQQGYYQLYKWFWNVFITYAVPIMNICKCFKFSLHLQLYKISKFILYHMVYFKCTLFQGIFFQSSSSIIELNLHLEMLQPEMMVGIH